MCKPISAIVLHSDSGIEIFSDDHTDSHEHLISALGLNDSECQRYRGREWCRIEYCWPDDATDETVGDLSTWTLVLDEQDSIAWWTPEVAAEVRTRMDRIAESRLIREARGTLLGGAWIFASGGSVRRIVGGRMLFVRGANLSGANLSGANLCGADLRGADLYEANLSGANLSDADLYGANLSDADLRGANLRGADLRGADLRGADLRGANLRDANLSGAYLSGAYLSGANLSDADLRGAYLSDADLSDADLRGANLSDADLRYANLRGANLRGADLRGADLSDSCRLASDPDIAGWIVVGGRLARGES
jgi:hypothetical protein